MLKVIIPISIFLLLFVSLSRVRLYLHIDTETHTFAVYIKILCIKINLLQNKKFPKNTNKKTSMQPLSAISYLNIIKTEKFQAEISLGTYDAAATALLTGNIKILLSMICSMLYKNASKSAFNINVIPYFEKEIFIIKIDSIISAKIWNITLQTIKNIRRTSK